MTSRHFGQFLTRPPPPSSRVLLLRPKYCSHTVTSFMNDPLMNVFKTFKNLS